MSQREKRNESVMMAAENELDASQPESIFPAELTRRYTLVFKPITPAGADSDRNTKALAVRNVRGEHLGHLITVRGIATRVSDVKPSVQVNAYTCDRCGCEIFQPVTSKQFTPMTECRRTSAGKTTQKVNYSSRRELPNSYLSGSQNTRDGRSSPSGTYPSPIDSSLPWNLDQADEPR